MVFKNLNEIEQKELVPGFKAKFIHSENMTFAYVDVEQNASFPEHSHPNEQVVNIIEGKFEFVLEGKTKIIEPGDIVVIPPNIKHSGKAITKCKIIDVFYPVREDYKSV